MPFGASSATFLTRPALSKKSISVPSKVPMAINSHAVNDKRHRCFTHNVVARVGENSCAATVSAHKAGSSLIHSCAPMPVIVIERIVAFPPGAGPEHCDQPGALMAIFDRLRPPSEP